MTCHNCRSECRKFSKRQNRQRYQCHQFRKVFTDARDNLLDRIYLPIEKAEMVLRLLLEGNSVSSVERATEVHHTTILKLPVLVGEKCERIMAEKVRNVQVRDVECDEVWSFIGKKQKRVRSSDNALLGDSYVFVGIERHSKLVLNRVEGLRHVKARTPFQIPRMDSRHTAPLSLRRFMIGSLASLNSSRFTALPKRVKPATARRGSVNGGCPNHGAT